MDTNLPGRMATRGIVRNYNESADNSTEKQPDGEFDGAFRIPTSLNRPRKRRAYEDHADEIPKRGRPRGTSGPAYRVSRGGLNRRDMGLSDEESPLYDAVKSGKGIEHVIDKWIEKLEEDEDKALLELLQLFISVSGCHGRLNLGLIARYDYPVIVQHMTEEFDEDSADYPIVMPGAQWRRFRANLAQFVISFVVKCKAKHIFNDSMMQAVLGLLVSLADSKVRAFRHTATYIAMIFSSSLVDVTLELSEKKQRNDKQIEGEQTKLRAAGAADSSEKLEVLIAKKTELKKQMEEITYILQFLFKSIFVHRYRDVVPDMRVICINELGKWMSVYPNHFLDDSYLKYVGWTLHDKVPEVRLKCLDVLLPLFSLSEHSGRVELFANKFKERLVSMVQDRNVDAAVRACEIMSAIYKAFPKVLTKDDCIPIYELVYTNHRPLAVAAGEFLNVKVFPNASPPGANIENNKVLLLDLIRFFIEGECHEHGAYLVDSLIDTNDMIKDWAAYLELLKSDEATQCDGQIIEIMCCAVKQAATGDHPVGRSASKRGPPAYNSRDARLLGEERTKISEVFIPQLPVLLQTYIADRDKICNLITLPLYFQLEMYLAGQLTQHAGELMKMLESIVERHPDRDLVAQISEVIEHLTSHSGTAQVTETARSKLVDGIFLQVRRQCDKIEKEEVLDDEDEAAIKSAFRKLVGMACHIDTYKQDVFSQCLKLTMFDEGRVPAEVVQLAIQYMGLILIWDCDRLLKDREHGRSESVKALSKRVNAFFSSCQQIMKEHVSGLETTYLLICDNLIIFSDFLSETNPAFKSLVYKMDPQYLRRLKTYVIDNVFTPFAAEKYDQQEQLELMMKRRRLLANYGKLVIHGVIPISEADEIFEQYVNFYQDFGDIMRMIVYKCRDMSMLSTALTVTKALFSAFEKLKSGNENEHVDPVSENFSQVRDLARKLASVFGNDHNRNREAIAQIHREGIVFAFEIKNGRGAKNPRNVAFLEILVEFSAKLVRQDKECVYRYVLKHAATYGRISHTEEPQWSSYLIYKDSLKEKNLDDTASVRSHTTMNTSRAQSVVSTPRRGRPRINRFDD